MATNAELDLVEALVGDLLDGVRDKPTDIAGIALLTAGAALYQRDAKPATANNFIKVAMSCYLAAATWPK